MPTSNPAWVRDYQDSDPRNRKRSDNLWRLYRITEDEYDDLRAAQNYECAICHIHEDDIDLKRVGGRPRADGASLVKFALQVDHCHDRDAIRGLLCPDCNSGIARLRDDPAVMRRAADYVERTPVRMIDRQRRWNLIAG